MVTFALENKLMIPVLIAYTVNGDFFKLKSRPTVYRYACACNPSRTLRGEKYNHIRDV